MEFNASPSRASTLFKIRVRSGQGMDDDIADILASVSAPPISQRTLDLQALTRAWVAERTAPELLPYPTELVERVMERLGKQVRGPA